MTIRALVLALVVLGTGVLTGGDRDGGYYEVPAIPPRALARDPLAGLEALGEAATVAAVPTQEPPVEAMGRPVLQPLPTNHDSRPRGRDSPAHRAEREGALATLIEQYPWPVERALRVVYGGAPGCPEGESGGDPTAYNPAGPYVGLFQVSLEHRWTYEQLIQPTINVAAAFELWTRRGWAPWPVCGAE